MATIPPYFAKGTHAGQHEAIWAITPITANVGSGQVVKFDDYNCSFNGRIDVLVPSIHTDLTMDLELTDHNPVAQSGPAKINLKSNVISGEDSEAHYQVVGSSLVVNCAFGGGKQTITVYPITVSAWFTQHEETELDLGDNKIHLSPQ